MSFMFCFLLLKCVCIQFGFSPKHQDWCIFRFKGQQLLIYIHSEKSEELNVTPDVCW